MSESDLLHDEQLARRYRIAGSISQGTRFNVLLAYHARVGLPMAIKILRADSAEDEDVAGRVESEFELLSLQVQNSLVPIYDVGRTSDGRPYAVMAYLEGIPLTQWARVSRQHGQTISTKQLLTMVRQIALGLAKLHGAGISHHDLNPGNVLVRPDLTPVIVGLGLPADLAGQVSRESGVEFPQYIAPEVMSGESPDAQSNIFSLGAILHELLSLNSPEERGEPLAYDQTIPLEHVREDLSAETTQLVNTCLQQDPDERFQSMRQLIIALDKALAVESGGVFSQIADRWIAVDVRTWFSQYRQYVLVALPIMLLVIFGIVYLFLQAPDNLFAGILYKPTVMFDMGATASARATRKSRASGDPIGLLEPAVDAVFERGSELRFHWCWIEAPLEQEKYALVVRTGVSERRLNQPAREVDRLCYETLVNGDEFENESEIGWRIELTDQETDELVAISDWRFFLLLAPDEMMTTTPTRDASPTNTATPTDTPSPSPTNTAMATATPTPSPTPSATPTATPLPPTATPTNPPPTATDTPAPPPPRPPTRVPPTATPRPPDPTPTPP